MISPLCYRLVLELAVTDTRCYGSVVAAAPVDLHAPLPGGNIRLPFVTLDVVCNDRNLWGNRLNADPAVRISPFLLAGGGEVCDYGCVLSVYLSFFFLSVLLPISCVTI